MKINIDLSLRDTFNLEELALLALYKKDITETKEILEILKISKRSLMRFKKNINKKFEILTNNKSAKMTSLKVKFNTQLTPFLDRKNSNFAKKCQNGTAKSGLKHAHKVENKKLKENLEKHYIYNYYYNNNYIRI